MKIDYLAPVGAVAGVALILASFAWPHVANQAPGGWTEEKAQQHAQTRAELHAASHALQPGGKAHGDEAARARELQAQFDSELAELESARNRGDTGGRLLWWSGAILVLTGAAVFILRRSG
jgi:hypothetical protein